MTAEDLIAAQRLVRRLPVGESVVEAILKLVRSARPGPEAGDLGKLISWGPGPRASQALMLAVRALRRRSTTCSNWRNPCSSTAWR